MFLIVLRKNKPGAHGVLALKRLTGKDADAAGLMDTEQYTTGLPFATRHIAGRLHFAADLLEYRRGTLHHERTLRNTPGLDVGDCASSRPFFVNFVHVVKEHLNS